MKRNELADRIAEEAGIPDSEYSTGQKITFHKTALRQIYEEVKTQ